MPNNNDDQNKGGAGGEGAGAGAGAGQGGEGAGNGAGAGAGQGAGGEGETVTMKKSELDKLQSDLKKSNEDRDNYKKVALGKKADERNLGGGQGGGEGAGQGGGQGGGNVIDEKKVGEVASSAANKVMRDASERTAKRAFLKAHPEYLDDAQWTALMSHFAFKGGELTYEDVLDRMEAAVLEHKRSTGKLDEYLKSEHDRGVREGRIQGNLEGAGAGTGGPGDRGEGGKGAGALSPKGEEMARAMHVDLEKVKKVDPSKDNVIDVTKV